MRAGWSFDVGDEAMADEFDLDGDAASRRRFLKRLAIGAAAVPVISTFSLAGCLPERGTPPDGGGNTTVAGSS